VQAREEAGGRFDKDKGSKEAKLQQLGGKVRSEAWVILLTH
jgi:hypothetical protein